MALIVQKFGGTSVKDAERLEHVAKLVTAQKNAGNDVIVVVSAQGKHTDELIAKAREVSPDPPKRELDFLMVAGEQISAALLAMVIKRMGFPHRLAGRLPHKLEPRQGTHPPREYRPLGAGAHKGQCGGGYGLSGR